jgi:hypothetical protein
MVCIKLDICDYPIALELADPRVIESVHDRYRVYLTDKPARVHLRIDTKDEPLGQDREIEPLVEGPQEGFIFTIQRYDMSGWINPLQGIGYARLWYISSTLDSFLRVVYSILLLQEEGILLHAASLVIDGKGFLFPGESGTGKTTLARKFPEGVLLSDEISCVKRIGGSFVAIGTPFLGEFHKGVSNRVVPLERILFIQKGPPNRCEPIDKETAFIRTLGTLLFFCNEPRLHQSLLKGVKQLIFALPTFTLQYAPEDLDATSLGHLLAQPLASIQQRR